MQRLGGKGGTGAQAPVTAGTLTDLEDWVFLIVFAGESDSGEGASPQGQVLLIAIASERDVTTIPDCFTAV
jgi:hypothetical protein